MQTSTADISGLDRDRHVL